MEAENARLREAAKSSTKQLERANKRATETQREAANLKKELDLLKAKIREEEQQKIEAQAQADKKEGDLRKSIESLLSKMLQLLYLSFFAKFSSTYNDYSLQCFRCCRHACQPHKQALGGFHIGRYLFSRGLQRPNSRTSEEGQGSSVEVILVDIPEAGSGENYGRAGECFLYRHRRHH
jgi:hypothetical protein